MRSGRSVFGLAVLAAALAVLLGHGVRSQVHTQVGSGLRRADGRGRGAALPLAPGARTRSACAARPPLPPPTRRPQVEILDDSCDAKLQYLWGNYTNPPVAPVAGCDRACLSACYNTLNVRPLGMGGQVVVCFIQGSTGVASYIRSLPVGLLLLTALFSSGCCMYHVNACSALAGGQPPPSLIGT